MPDDVTSRPASARSVGELRALVEAGIGRIEKVATPPSSCRYVPCMRKIPSSMDPDVVRAIDARLDRVEEAFRRLTGDSSGVVVAG